jgi:hypothetical protein
MEPIHYTEMRKAQPGDPFFHEWNTYLRELPSMLAGGHEAQFVLLRDEEVVGFFETEREAQDAGLKRYLLGRFLVQQIRAYEPIFSARGYDLPWPVSVFQSAKPA